MIYVNTVTNYNRTQFELEEFWLFSMCVAGKKADQTARKVDAFIEETLSVSRQKFPLDGVNYLLDRDILEDLLQKHRLGQYTRIHGALEDTLDLYDVFDWDPGFLQKATIEDLESIHGIGPKTARFFAMHSRPDQRVAALDTHILHFLRDCGHDAPKLTPTGHRYRELEQIFLEEADRSGMSVADFDLMLWRQYSGN